jgi:hypothetical protein
VPTIGYALIVVSVTTTVVERIPGRWANATLAAGAIGACAVFGWFAYQTIEQNEHFADATGDFERFERDVTAVFPDVPSGARVEIIGGPFQRYEYQLFILPSFAETVWGPNRSLQDYEPGSLPAEIALASENPYVAEYLDGQLVRVPRGDDGDR